MKPNTILFDVNETLLDLGPVRASVGAALGGGGNERAALWFRSLLHLSLVYSAGRRFRPFGQLASHALVAAARELGIELGGAEAEEALQPLLSSPPLADVAPGLERLRRSGFRLAALTNSSSEALRQQMASSGLAELFDQLLSVEEVGLYKPHREVYLWAAQRMGAKAEVCLMAAAHDWDVMGAAWAGLQTAFIARSEQRYPVEEPAPTHVASGIEDLAETLC